MPSKKNKNPKITGKSQKGQSVPEFTEDQARTFFEKIRWPNGPACVHCGSVDVYRMTGEATRPGLLKCRDCRQQFTVTVGTVMEDSHLPLSTWAKAYHMAASAKKGVSALQLQRNLGLGSYRTAWFLAHRIREAMRAEPVSGMLTGTVEVDETYIGGKPRKGATPFLPVKRKPKAPVMAMIERGGKMRSRAVADVTGSTLKSAIKECVDPQARIVTDESNSYSGIGPSFAGGHHTVNHSIGEYARGDVYTNTAESYFALMKRGVYGTFHHVSKKHLHRYCDEFAFRWNGRELEDAQRRDEAVRGAEGKRLYYSTPVARVRAAGDGKLS